jgi:hypothetical protein
MDRKLLVVMLVYMAWQIVFPMLMSPLGLGILTAEQMGYVVDTLPLGFAVGAITLILISLLATTKLGVSLYANGLRHIKTRKEFEQFWKITLRGCDDGIIAESHWSGTILPLLMMGFQVTGIPYPVCIGPAILLRWILHVGSHLMFPRSESGERDVGGVKFFAVGLAYSDVINSLAFIISGNIVAPVLLHHLSGYVSTWAGNKKRVAQALNISLTP